MVKKKLNIENLFKQGFEHFEVQPSERVWNGIRSGLFRKHFMRFNPGHFNIYYLSTAIIIGTLTLITLTAKKEDVKEPLNQNQTTLELPGDNIPVVQENQVVEKIVPKSNRTEAQQKDFSVKNPLKNTGPVQDQLTTTTRQGPDVKSPEEKEQNTISPVARNVPNSLVLAYFSVSTREGCAPLSVNFTNRSENASAYSWSFGDGGISAVKNPSYIFDEPGTYFINLTVTSAGGEISVYTDSIHVYSLPEIRFNLDSDVIPGSGQPVYFYNYSKGAEYFEWNFGDGNTSIQKEPSHYYEKPGNYDVSLTGQSVSGCRDTLVMKNALKEKSPEILFPTAFAPNRNGPSDGYYSPKDPKNEIFHPVVVEGVEEYQLKIFNRAGLLIFESNDINIGWDGYYHEVLMPQGVYIWKVRGRFAGGRSFVKMGDVTLLWTQLR